MLDMSILLGSFGLILGHLVGDYIFQNDWMAKNKTNGPNPGPFFNLWCGAHANKTAIDYWQARSAWYTGNLACTVHCLLYTLAVFLFSYSFLTWWTYPVIFLAHWPVDRWRLAAWWMKNVSGQEKFASKEHPMFPWSIVVVDNIAHLLVLYGCALWGHL